MIEQNAYQSYLEIGYGNGDTYHQVYVEKKVGIDKGDGTPSNDRYVTRVASDEYFQNLRAAEDKTSFDIIFVDGAHLKENVKRDIENSLDFLSPNGTIVVHDCNPPNKYFQEREQSPHAPGWTGDGWKAFVQLRASREDLSMQVVDTDYGCGIIRPGSQQKLEVPAVLEYKDFEVNKEKWLNLISVEDFKGLYKGHTSE